MYAIVKTGGKQYKVAEGDVLFVENGCRNQRTGQTGGGSSSGCGLASVRYDPEKRSYHPSGQPEQRGSDLSVCDRGNLRRISVPDPGE